MKLSMRPCREWLPYMSAALFASLLVILATGFSLWQESERYRERAEIFTQNTSKLLAQHIGDVFGRSDRLLQIVIYFYNNHRASGAVDATHLSSYLQQTLASAGEFLNLRITDARGVVRYSVGAGNAVGLSIADRDYFTRLRDLPAGSANATMVLSPPLLERSTQKWVLILARRIENTDGSFAGIAYTSLNHDVFNPVFAAVQLGPQGTIVLRNSDMAQIDRFPRGPQPEKDIGNRRVSETLLDLLQTNPQGATYEATTRFDDVRRYYTYLRVSPYPIYIIVGEAKGDLVRNLGNTLYLLLALSSLMIALINASMWRVYRMSRQHLRLRSAQQAERIIEASPLPMLVINQEHGISKANQAAAELFGYSVDELQHLQPCKLMAAHPPEIPREKLAQRFFESAYVQTPMAPIELMGLRRDQTQMPLKVSISAIEFDHMRYMIAVLEDQSELKVAQARLENLAHYDPLTALPNRRLFFERAEQALTLARAQSQGLALLFMDLNQFKPINDTWGHAVGDLVLQEIGRRILGCVRSTDTVGRIGGDEFVVLLHPIENEVQVQNLAQAIQQAIIEPMLIEGRNLCVGTSIGIALYPEHGNTPAELAKHADTAMYIAKVTGNDQIVG